MGNGCRAVPVGVVFDDGDEFFMRIFFDGKGVFRNRFEGNRRRYAIHAPFYADVRIFVTCYR